MANFLTNLFSAGASSLVEAVGDAIDKNITSDEEKKELENELAKASMQYDVEMATLGLEEKKLFSRILPVREKIRVECRRPKMPAGLLKMFIPC